ncbi:MAG: ABC transporter ATP-binding protein [Alphaproteobacteria bacterium]|nr:ABC transporter ATP-binding protein [Alphaproteobacteria bacterium]
MPYRKRLLIAAGCMVLVAGATAAQAYMVKPVLDDIFVNKDADKLLILPFIILLIAFAGALGDYGQSLQLRYVGQKVVTDMQGALFAHLIRADITTFHDQTSGRLISRMTNDIMLMRLSVSNVLTGFIKEAMTALFLVGLMFWQSWQMALFTFFILLFGVLPTVRLGRRMRKITDATQSKFADFTSQLDDTFQGVRAVKAYGREEFETHRVRNMLSELFRLYFKASRVQAASGPIMNLIGAIAIAGVVWYGGFEVIRERTTAGEFFSFLTAMMMAYRPVKVLSSLNTQLQEGMAAAQRYFDVMDTANTITQSPHAAPLAIAKGEVVLQNVSFAYGTGKGGVEQVSFIVPAGKTVALVGPSGGGKTTLMNLLLRFYDAQSGHITIDGQNIKDVTIASLRNAFALVSQDIVLFDDTVRGNIAYGKLDASEAEIIEAAKKAHADAFIRELPQGYDTPIGPHGVKLSGGQRQRLSIARAILKNAPILLLDEATSALDNTSERLVQDALAELMQHRTTLVIAHRLSTIHHADQIVVLDKGRIVASGTHQSLIAEGGLYHDLYQLQFAQ